LIRGNGRRTVFMSGLYDDSYFLLMSHSLTAGTPRNVYFMECFPLICPNVKQYTSALVMRYWYCVNGFIITWLTLV